VSGLARDPDPASGPVPVPDAAAMRDLGARLAAYLTAGDLVVLSGELGAGKTTLVQGLATGLGVTGPVTSPTFVLARTHHPARPGGPPLVHVDAYRLGSLAEVEDLDLDATLAEAVTVVEWGAGKVEGLSADRLEVEIHRPTGGDAGETRWVRWRGVGPRWAAGVPDPGQPAAR